MKIPEKEERQIVHGSSFSGIGGFEYGAELLGWHNAFHCEINPFARRLLKYYWPNAISYENTTTTDYTIWRGLIDVFTGGFPCQPFSTAGLRNGTADGRYYWPESLRGVREIKPPAFVGENVTGLLTMGKREVFARVDSRNRVRYTDVDSYEAVYTRQSELLFNSICEDLEKEGYEVQPFVIPAAGSGAPHRRDRVWIVAYSRDAELQRRQKLTEGLQPKGRGEAWGEPSSFGGLQLASNPTGTRRRKGQCRGSSEQFNKDVKAWGINAYPPSFKLQGSQGTKIKETARCAKPSGFYSAGYGPWKDFPTQSPICSGNDGLPSQLDGITLSKWRNESIKGFGNAIVPQVFMQIGKGIEELLRETNY